MEDQIQVKDNYIKKYIYTVSKEFLELSDTSQKLWQVENEYDTTYDMENTTPIEQKIKYKYVIYNTILSILCNNTLVKLKLVHKFPTKVFTNDIETPLQNNSITYSGVHKDHYNMCYTCMENIIDIFKNECNQLGLNDEYRYLNVKETNPTFKNSTSRVCIFILKDSVRNGLIFEKCKSKSLKPYFRDIISQNTSDYKYIDTYKIYKHEDCEHHNVDFRYERAFAINVIISSDEQTEKITIPYLQYGLVLSYNNSYNEIKKIYYNEIELNYIYDYKDLFVNEKKYIHDKNIIYLILKDYLLKQNGKFYIILPIINNIKEFVGKDLSIILSLYKQYFIMNHVPSVEMELYCNHHNCIKPAQKNIKEFQREPINYVRYKNNQYLKLLYTNRSYLTHFNCLSYKSFSNIITTDCDLEECTNESASSSSSTSNINTNDKLKYRYCLHRFAKTNL
jgi:hypothetical protein